MIVATAAASAAVPNSPPPPTGRPGSNLTINTSFLPPAPASSRQPSSKPQVTRSTSSSSLLAKSPSNKTPTSRTKTPPASSPSPSLHASSSKRISPRCASPASCSSSSSSDQSAWMLRPGVSPTAASRGGALTTTTTTSSVATPPGPPHFPQPISAELYFRVLKKSHVLDQLLEVSSHLESQQQHMRKLEANCSKNESVHEFVFQELELYKRKYVEAQKYMLEVVEAMTQLSLKEEELQRGTGTKEAVQLAEQKREERVLLDLEIAMNDKQQQRQDQQQQDQQDQDGALGRSVESSALRTVGLQRVDHLASVCLSYEKQLMKSEAELSRAMHSAYKDECLAKLAGYEEMQKHHDDEMKELRTRVDNLKHQNTELHDFIDDQRDELAQLKQTNQALCKSKEQQTASIEKFGAQLKAELRKRYGVVPSLVDTRWHEFFPDCSSPI